MPAGRPTKYDKRLADTILGLVAEGVSLRKIVAIETMPKLRTICRWLAEKEEFRQQFDASKESMAHIWADEILDIADDDSKDLAGELQLPNGVAVNRAKLRIDTRWKLVSKLLPKQYGDKLQAEHSGSVGIQLVHSIPQPQREES